MNEGPLVALRFPALSEGPEYDVEYHPGASVAVSLSTTLTYKRVRTEHVSKEDNHGSNV